jgi:hypothetical protein
MMLLSSLSSMPRKGESRQTPHSKARHRPEMTTLIDSGRVRTGTITPRWIMISDNRLEALLRDREPCRKPVVIHRTFP